MAEMEDTLMKTKEIDPDYRLWITCEITLRFPIGLLQMAIKVTLEPPAGLKAGLSRTYTTMVSQESLDKIDHVKWRTMVFVQAHTIQWVRTSYAPGPHCARMP